MGYNGPQQQMKKILLLAVAMFVATFSFAQQQLATLNHNDSITVYYGATALQQAHSAAVNGDIITLSPGAFQSVNITKAITLRGAGMYTDTVAGTEPTTLLGNFTLTVENDSLHNLYLEGLACANTMYYSKVYNPRFVKCLFRTISYTDSQTMRDAMFMNCIMENFQNYYNYNNNFNIASGGYAQNTMFVNSVILDLDQYGSPTLINCVAKFIPAYLNDGISVRNSILYHDNGTSSTNVYSVYNSVGIYTGNSSYNYFNSTGTQNHQILNYNRFASVFKTFRGSIADGVDFQLLDTIVTSFLGTDGTQVGIYGGIMPFDPSVRNPLIKKCNVASRSTADGKLAVDIEIVSE